MISPRAILGPYTEMQTDAESRLHTMLSRAGPNTSGPAREAVDNEILGLLSDGASVRFFGPNGKSPLYYAAMDQRLAVCTRLLELGSDVHHTCNLGFTPLHSAQMSSQPCDGAVTALLIQAGAHVDAQTWTTQRTALHLAARHNRVRAIGILAAAGAEVELIDYDDRTALGSAAAEGHPGACVALVNVGADASGVAEYSSSAEVLGAVAAAIIARDMGRRIASTTETALQIVPTSRSRPAAL